jgi:hypothetical protein
VSLGALYVRKGNEMNLNTPTIYAPEVVATLSRVAQCGLSDGRIVAARPEGWFGLCLSHRLRCAWLVFTGQADVLQWQGQP